MNPVTILAVFASVATYSLACVGQTNFDEVDRFILAEMRRQHIPALSVSVVQGGETHFIKGYGKANLELDAAASMETVYQLASVTKPITAMAVMTLIEDGKLSLSDEIGKHLDDLPVLWQGITIRQLLSHTSGIKDFTNAEIEFRKDHVSKEVLDYVSTEPLEFPPGRGWGYSNTNFFVLGVLVEKKTGKPFGEYLQDRIFEPVGMTKTRMNDLHAIFDGRAQGYEWNGTSQRVGDYHSPTLPFAAGGLVTTVSDMAKLDIALVKGEVLQPKTLESMWETAVFETDTGKQEAEYGFGWQITEQGGVRMVGHGGGIPGFSNFYMRLVDKDVAVIVLMNQQNADPMAVIRGIVGVLGLLE